MFVYESFFVLLWFVFCCALALCRQNEKPSLRLHERNYENIAQRFDRTQQQEQDDSTNTIDAHLPNEWQQQPK